MIREKLAVYGLLINSEALQDLERLTLSLPKEIIHELTAASEKKLIDINVGIISRLILTIINPQIFGLNPKIDAQATKAFLKTIEKASIKGKKKGT